MNTIVLCKFHRPIQYFEHYFGMLSHMYYHLPRWKFVLYVTELSFSPSATSQLVRFPPFLMSPLITFKYLKPFLTERSKGA